MPVSCANVDCSSSCAPCSCLLDLQHSYHGKYQISINQIQFVQTHIRMKMGRPRHTYVHASILPVICLCFTRCYNICSVLLPSSVPLGSMPPLTLTLQMSSLFVWLAMCTAIYAAFGFVSVCVLLWVCVCFRICNCICVFDCHQFNTHTNLSIDQLEPKEEGSLIPLTTHTYTHRSRA